MRIVVIIFAVLALLGATGLGSLTYIRCNKDVESVKKYFEELETLKAAAEKDEASKMSYELTKSVTEKAFGDLTPGKISTFGLLALVTGIVAFVTLVLVFTKMDNITMYLSIAGILLAVITYFVAPSLADGDKATYKDLGMILLIQGIVGFGLSILAGKLRKPAAA